MAMFYEVEREREIHVFDGTARFRNASEKEYLLRLTSTAIFIVERLIEIVTYFIRVSARFDNPIFQRM